LRKTLETKKVKIESLNRDITPQLIDGVQISILNPPPLLVTKDASGRKVWDPSFLNNHSLAMRLQFKKIGLLLAGDIQKEAEYRILRTSYPLRSDLLKIPHHGSASSSTLPFLQRVKPRFAILSVGERNIGRLPRPEVLKRYEEMGSEIFRTDKHGAITVITDGNEIEMKPFVRSGL
jgi:competence protein ComEC